MPSALIWRSTCSDWSRLAMIAVSVSSISSRRGGKPVSIRTWWKRRGSSGWFSCTGDTLIATFDLWSQPAASAQARRSTQSPSARIRPCSSARGMNSAGETGPRRGWVQRTRAS